MNLLVTAGNTPRPHRPRARPHQRLHRPHRRRHRLARPRPRPSRRLTYLTPRSGFRPPHPDVAGLGDRWTLLRYNTFDDLHHLMETHIRAGDVDA